MIGKESSQNMEVGFGAQFNCIFVERTQERNKREG